MTSTFQQYVIGISYIYYCFSYLLFLSFYYFPCLSILLKYYITIFYTPFIILYLLACHA
ncbi:hypothetical protein BJX66DRAFT_318559 [Aspergillus keveii]|uniref:Uncharacterized protein n=1 Tax=Aspergillus keveii TaxID=714993 RepID=A0ABR4FJI8_9EURO